MHLKYILNFKCSNQNKWPETVQIKIMAITYINFEIKLSHNFININDTLSKIVKTYMLYLDISI